MNAPVDRRRFLARATLAGVGLGAMQKLSAREDAARPALAEKVPPSERLIVAVMGTNGRGAALAAGFAALRTAEVACVADVDSRAAETTAAAVEKVQGRRPRVVTDFRRALDDAAVGALVIAAPDHWHAPAAILACAAGKHVYVEKPCSHNPREGELLVAAARKHRRVVQHGTQRRSWPGIVAGIEELRAGAIGRVLLARGWYANARASIGRGKLVEVPSWLDYALWQGPAPERPFRDNLVHYFWHWYWHWGTGEIGNNGVHALDLCRWGLGVDFPVRVSSGGAKLFADDDQETPDTHVVTYDFAGKTIVWEGTSWHPRGFEGAGFGAAFSGERGTLVLTDSGFVIYDRANKEVERRVGPTGDAVHLEDFVRAVRTGSRPSADAEEAHKSTLLCHLGNIAHRTASTLELDESNGRLKGSQPEAELLWSREYRTGWEPKV